MAIVDLAGNTLGVAFDLGSVSGRRTVTDFVSSTNPVDFFRFRLNTDLDLDFSLYSHADADLAIAQDGNLNGVIDAGEYLSISNSLGMAEDAININSLPAGTYYIGVYHSSGDTNYNLYLSATNPSKTFNSNYGYGLVDAAASVAFGTGKTSRFPEVPDLGGINWGLDMIKAPEVWSQGYTGKGITVAVLDSGVDVTHPDLDDNIWINSDEISGNGIDDDPLDYVVAPGLGVYSTTPNNTYYSLDGTSMSTPYVSGVAALLLGANHTLAPSEVESVLTRTANPLGIIG